MIQAAIAYYLTFNFIIAIGVTAINIRELVVEDGMRLTRIPLISTMMVLRIFAGLLLLIPVSIVAGLTDGIYRLVQKQFETMRDAEVQIALGDSR